jgi:hypothetical protein
MRACGGGAVLRSTIGMDRCSGFRGGERQRIRHPRPAPVAPAVHAEGRRSSAGINPAVQCLVAFPGLDPFEPAKAVAAGAGDELLGGELAAEFLASGMQRQVDKARRERIAALRGRPLQFQPTVSLTLQEGRSDRPNLQPAQLAAIPPHLCG